jgi:hypothetical protein
VFAGLVALSLWADAQWFFLSRYWKEDTRTAVACLAELGVANSIVAVAPGYMRDVVEHYASRAGQRMVVVGVSTAAQLGASRASALLTTRLHHATDEAALVRAFRDGKGGRVREARAPGYRIHARAMEGAAPSGRACGAAG